MTAAWTTAVASYGMTMWLGAKTKKFFPQSWSDSVAVPLTITIVVVDLIDIVLDINSAVTFWNKDDSDRTRWVAGLLMFGSLASFMVLVTSL